MRLDLIGWGSFLIIVLSGVLSGYWLVSKPTATIVVLSIMFVPSLIITIKRWRVFRNEGSKGILVSCTTGTVIVIGFSSLFIFGSGGKFLFEAGGGERTLIGITLSTPLMLFAIHFIPELPYRIRNKLSYSVNNKSTIYIIRALTDAIINSLFKKKTIRSMQAIVVSFVFILYYLLPRSSRLLLRVGIHEVNGKPLDEVLTRFSAIISTWTIPNPEVPDSMKGFILGNYGLVLIILMWSFATLMVWADVASRLENIPNLCKSRFSRFMVPVHVVIFYMYFIMFFLVAAIMIPYIGIYFLGYSIAIIFGVFAFSLFLPRLFGYFLSLSYLIAVFLNTEMNRDTVDINTATIEELTKVPGIGKNLSKSIIEKRPYIEIDDLIKIKGLSNAKIDIFRDYISV